MHVSVIIPCYDAAEPLRRCLIALSHQTVRRDHYEIIVVDDGSTEAITVAPAMPGIQVLRCEHSGPAAARNCGARYASGNVLLFTDADCVPSEDWIEKMCEPFSDNQVAGVKGVYQTKQKGLLPRFVQAEFEEKYAKLHKASQIDFVDTYSAGYRRAIFLANGGFDPAFPGTSAEDVEFSFRLFEGGNKMVFAAEAAVYHSHPTSVWRYLRKKFRFGYWRAKVYRRFPNKMYRDSYTPRSVTFQILLSPLLSASVVATVFRQFALPIALCSLVLFLASTSRFCFRTYARDKAVALVSPALLFLRSMAQFSGLLTGLAASLAPRRNRNATLGCLAEDKTI